MPRSGFCNRSRPWDDPSHGRCRMRDCVCECHDEAVKAKAAALVEDPPPPMTLLARVEHPMASLLDTLKFMADGVAANALRTVEEMSGEEALRNLHALRESLAILRAVDAALVRSAYLHGEHGDVRLEGLPPAKVQRGKDRKDWDSRGAVFAYLDRKMAETGEVPEPEQVATWVLEILGVSYVRVTPMRGAGLDPAEYCTETPGSLSVQFVT